MLGTLVPLLPSQHAGVRFSYAHSWSAAHGCHRPLDPRVPLPLAITLLPAASHKRAAATCIPLLQYHLEMLIEDGSHLCQACLGHQFLQEFFGGWVVGGWDWVGGGGGHLSVRPPLPLQQ